MDVAELSPTAYVVLGMLRLGCRSGYEIKRMVDSSTRFFWAASHAQIYPELKRLEQLGLIDGRPEPRGKRPRVLYQLRPTGERALHDWLDADDAPSFELRDMGLLKLFFADTLERNERRALVERVRARHERMLSELNEQLPAATALSEERTRCPLLTLQAGIRFHELVIGWCEQLERELARTRR